MMSHRNIAAIALVIVAVIVIGEVMVYGSDLYRSESDVSLEGTDCTVTMDTNYATEYTVLVTETVHNGEQRHLYIYRDFDYASFIEDSYLDYWIGKMEAEFEVFNFTDYAVIDARSLADMMAGSVFNGAAEETALLMLTGVLPDTVYGEEESIFETWLAAGGAVYWSGQPLGMYVGHERSVDPVPDMVCDDPGERFFGIPGSIGTDAVTDHALDMSSDRELGEALNIYYDNCNYGVSSEVPDSIFIGCEKDGYNSIALSRYAGGTGQICIYGGAFPPSDMQTAHSNILKTFFSGLYYDSEVVLLENSEKGKGQQEVSFQIDPEADTVVFVMYGSMLGTYGCTYRLGVVDDGGMRVE